MSQTKTAYLKCFINNRDQEFTVEYEMHGSYPSLLSVADHDTGSIIEVSDTTWEIIEEDLHESLQNEAP